MGWEVERGADDVDDVDVDLGMNVDANVNVNIKFSELVKWRSGKRMLDGICGKGERE